MFQSLLNAIPLRLVRRSCFPSFHPCVLVVFSDDQKLRRHPPYDVFDGVLQFRAGSKFLLFAITPSLFFQFGRQRSSALYPATFERQDESSLDSATQLSGYRVAYTQLCVRPCVIDFDPDTLPALSGFNWGPCRDNHNWLWCRWHHTRRQPRKKKETREPRSARRSIRQNVFCSERGHNHAKSVSGSTAL